MRRPRCGGGLGRCQLRWPGSAGPVGLAPGRGDPACGRGPAAQQPGGPAGDRRRGAGRSRVGQGAADRSCAERNCVGGARAGRCGTGCRGGGVVARRNVLESVATGRDRCRRYIASPPDRPRRSGLARYGWSGPSRSSVRLGGDPPHGAHLGRQPHRHDLRPSGYQVSARTARRALGHRANEVRHPRCGEVIAHCVTFGGEHRGLRPPARWTHVQVTGRGVGRRGRSGECTTHHHWTSDALNETPGGLCDRADLRGTALADRWPGATPTHPDLTAQPGARIKRGRLAASHAEPLVSEVKPWWPISSDSSNGATESAARVGPVQRTAKTS